MIVSFTANPAVDKTLVVEEMGLGVTNRARVSYVDPGGKGINVSRVAHRMGRPTLAVGILAGHMGKIAERALRREGVPSHFIWVKGETRLNTIISEESSDRETRVLDPGPRVRPWDLDRIQRELDRWLVGATVFVAAGSLPPGLPDDFYVSVLELAEKRNAATILDSDGDPFLEGLRGRPTVIKPNVVEASRLLGREIVGDAAIVEAARELVELGPKAVVISMGAGGAVLATDDRVVRAHAPEVEVQSTVGSGDSLVAGLAAALAAGDDLAEGLRLGTAAGAATALTEGTALCDPADIERLLPDVRLEELGA